MRCKLCSPLGEVLIVCPQLRPIELWIKIGSSEIDDRNIAEGGLLRVGIDGVGIKVVQQRHHDPDELNPVSVW